MPNICTFKVSDELFQGFEILLDLDYYDSNEEICNQMKQSLIGFLENHHFEVLAIKAQELHLHIHDVEFGTILLSDDREEFWVCGGCIENQDADSTTAPDAAAPDETGPQEVVAGAAASAAL